MNRKIEMFGMQIDVLSMDAAVNRLIGWVNDGSRRCRYVVTPNVDHVVQFQENAALKDAYETADLVLADGTPVVLAARLLGRRLPGRVAGADLVPTFFAAWQDRCRPLRVYLLGAAEGVAQIAAKRIMTAWPGVEVVGTYSPPIGFEHDDAENRRILEANIRRVARRACRRLRCSETGTLGCGASAVHRDRSCALRRSHDRFPGRPQTSRAPLDAALRPGMVAPRRQRAAPARKTVSPRRRGLSTSRLAAMAPTSRLTVDTHRR